MMMSPAFATTLAYDPTGNPYQMAYPAGATIYPATTTPFPVPATADPRTFEMIPHRIFVGGFPATTTELDLRLFFEKFGHVREAKVIRTSEGTSKGYGFITFDTEDEAKTVMQISANQDAEKLEFKGRRLNLGPAIRRMIHGPRYTPEYAIATPTGQLLTTTSAFGGVTYAFSQSPFVVMPPPNQVQPFVYSPVSTVAPAQCTLSNTDAGNNRAQQFVANNGTAPVMLVPNNSNTISPHDSPRTNNMGGQPQAVNGSVHIPTTGQPPQQQQQQQQQQQAYVSMQQIAQVTTQPLTPMTPSVATQRATLFPPAAAYYAPTAPANDMTHYSQMTAPTYFFAPSGYQTIDGSGQTAAMAIPAPNPIQLVPQPITPQTPQPCFYDESMVGGWQNSAEVRPTSTPRRSPMKSIVSLSNQLGQVNLQQYERKECQQGGNTAAATNKQFP